MINRTLHGKDILDLAEYSEGELSILHSELIKFTVSSENRHVTAG